MLAKVQEKEGLGEGRAMDEGKRAILHIKSLNGAPLDYNVKHPVVDEYLSIEAS